MTAPIIPLPRAESLTPRAFLYGRASQDRTREGRSVEDQLADGRRDAQHHRTSVFDEYPDIDRSASKQATREREHYERMLTDIARVGRQGDYLIAWEMSRLNRTMSGHMRLQELTERIGMLWVLGGRVYDPRSSADRQMLYMMAMQAEREADSIQERAERTTKAAAVKGTPHGKIPFGYARRYNQVTGRLEGQFPHGVHAAVVRGLFERAAEKESFNALVEVLRQYVPGASRMGLRYLLSNRTYIGLRAHKGEYVPATWDGIVDEGLFWRVQAVLQDEERRTTKDAKAKHLLSGIARCAVCVAAGAPEPGLRVTNQGRPRYRCQNGNHVATQVDRLDAFVEAAVFEWLSSAAANAAFRPDDDGEADRVRGRLAAMQVQLAEARAQAATFDETTGGFALSPAGLAAVERQLLPMIGKTEAKLQALTAAADPLLDRLAGASLEDVSAVWNTELSVAQRRHVLRRVVNVTLRRAAGRGVRALGADRVGLVFAGQEGFAARPQRGSAGWVTVG